MLVRFLPLLLLALGGLGGAQVLPNRFYNFTSPANYSNSNITNATTSYQRVTNLWDGFQVARGTITHVVEPLPIAKDELTPPPNMKPLHCQYRLPKDFIWGWASSASQIEGAVDADGRGPSVWDNVAHKVPGFLKKNETFDIANNHYYMYKQDFQRLKAMGVPYYSMTISWSRIFPSDSGEVNKAGLQHYIDEVNYLLENGIQPIVTLYHWDIPQVLQDKYGGWLDRKVVQDFANYARVMFEALPKVKLWLTLNEPQVFCNDYADWPDEGVPDHVFPTFGLNSTQRKYICGHNALLAHASAVHIYRTEIEPKYGKGKISFANSWDYTPSYSNSSEDILASERSLDFTAGWFGQPVYIDGEYPQSIRDVVYETLPRFTEEEKSLVLNSTDFYAWDGYTGHPVRASDDFSSCVTSQGDSENWPECFDEVFTLPGDWLIGNRADVGVSNWLYQTPRYFREGIVWAWSHFKPLEIIIPESGFSVWKENEMTEAQARYDDTRVSYLHDYLHQALKLIHEDKVKLSGIIAWSMYDNIEWRQGRDTRFGLQYFDYNHMKVYFKKSAFYMRDFFNHYMTQE
ncbi:beta-glucosidase [Sugiyamaella lignohabitans]|uniref:Beta-glucosidase n=1 Tax=Sugiyamaella lignohabitans TaxID=796027 RepID=A0A167C976_9ASCO|nr:beta-glucosidase [Sugiyamaella lignohabitans]ANB11383.1 beta-glucosidase [Sugiyamaella lignohabitans]